MEWEYKSKMNQERGGKVGKLALDPVPADTSTRELTNVSRQVVIRETEDKSSRSAPVYPAYQSRPNSLLKTQLNTVYAYAAGISPLAPEAQRSTIYTPSF
jgi:hypothetical protein